MIEEKPRLQIMDEIRSIEDKATKLFEKDDFCLVSFEIFGGGDVTDKSIKLHHMHIQVIIFD